MSQAATCKSWGYGRKTQSFGTKINILMPPDRKKKSKLTYYAVTTSTTAHTLTVLRALNVVLLTADAAASQAVVVLASDPGSYTTKRTANNLLAAGDYLVFECPDGTFLFDTVSSVVTNGDGTVSVTMATSLPTLGLKARSRCWFLGVAADVDPQTAIAHPVFTLAASSYNSQRASEGSLVETLLVNSPLLIQCDNATVASVIESVQGLYGP